MLYPNDNVSLARTRDELQTAIAYSFPRTVRRWEGSSSQAAVLLVRRFAYGHCSALQEAGRREFFMSSPRLPFLKRLVTYFAALDRVPSLQCHSAERYPSYEYECRRDVAGFELTVLCLLAVAIVELMRILVRSSSSRSVESTEA